MEIDQSFREMFVPRVVDAIAEVDRARAIDVVLALCNHVIAASAYAATKKAEYLMLAMKTADDLLSMIRNEESE